MIDLLCLFCKGYCLKEEIFFVKVNNYYIG